MSRTLIPPSRILIAVMVVIIGGWLLCYQLGQEHTSLSPVMTITVTAVIVIGLALRNNESMLRWIWPLPLAASYWFIWTSQLEKKAYESVERYLSFGSVMLLIATMGACLVLDGRSAQEGLQEVE